eukprot:CAMPEP_0181288380 /NCGR_PEP_ID=MMETSP1101-20121128/300_1 /TAXON_ID=46948 /ORGANISM="Rhodomonas abbreviata, Strain Caron Lab Isolate" /LENGTH=104 /DNA_ID=CAMNT_0023392495 /DNA_START=178 /DNA_END=492 /DNA_ORIENTATION=+
MSMYLRIKRQKQCIFLHCDPSDTILTIKQKIKGINNVEIADQRLLVTDEKIVCDESKTVKECKLEDGAVVALVYKKSQDPPEWEDIDIQSPPTAGDDQAARESG